MPLGEYLVLWSGVCLPTLARYQAAWTSQEETLANSLLIIYSPGPVFIKALPCDYLHGLENLIVSKTLHLLSVSLYFGAKFGMEVKN